MIGRYSCVHVGLDTGMEIQHIVTRDNMTRPEKRAHECMNIVKSAIRIRMERPAEGLEMAGG